MKHNVTTPLTIKNLTVANSRGQALLSDISVSLESGEILGVTGPTDSGKSLLGLAALGQIPATLRMTGGEVRVLQHSPFEDADRVRGKLAGLITQSPSATMVPLSSATGTNVPGMTRSRSGCAHLTNASAATA